MEHSADKRSSILRRCVIVAGMHRSGTSAYTRVVNLLGADVARELLPAGDCNERGFWEPSAVVDIHEQLLHALGSSWDDPFPLPDRWIEAGATQCAKQRLADEIRKDFGGSRLFVVKDPRITRLLPMWLEILDELAIETVVVIPVRNPLEIGASLETRDRFPLAKSLLLYARSCLDTELDSRRRRRLFVRYEQLLDDWRPFAARFAEATGSHTLPPGAKQADEIDRFLTAELRHHRYSRDDLSGTRDIAATTIEIFERMSEASDSGDEKELRRSFDRLRETLAEATRLYRGLVAAERTKFEEEATHLQGELASALARTARAVAELATTQDRGAAETTRLSAELAAALQRAVQSESSSSALAAETARLSAELAAALQRAVQSESSSSALAAETARLSAELAAASQRAVQSESSSSTLRAELDEIKQSSLWQLTRPLRLIGARLPWIRRIRHVLRPQARTGTGKLNPKSVLLVTLDSCRYDSFVAAQAPRMKSVGPLYRAMAPSNFTFGSHAAIFVGFTPGVANVATPFVNPKFAKIFKMAEGGFPGRSPSFISLEGRNIVDGFRRKGFATLGSGSVGWFDPQTPTGAVLTEGFDDFFYPGNVFSLEAQVAWAKQRIHEQGDRPVFLFLNIGETHVPYYFRGASWDFHYNPCVPFGSNNDSAECRRRQIGCVEFVDSQVADLLDQFAEGTVVLCADHGDCWGEDGVWEHGVSHPKVLEVPLIFRLGTSAGLE
jgi:hypothetical protein